MKIRFAVAALAATFLVGVQSASAQHPVIAGTPALFIGGDEFHGTRTPPAVPHIGDTLTSSWPATYCDPSCDPANPDADPTVGNREVFGGTPPAGIMFQFERCDNPDHCVVAQDRSTKNTYVVQPSDAGWMLRVVFQATNLDCSYPRSYDQYQHCAWDTESVPSEMTPPVPFPPAVAIGPATLPDGVAGTAYTLTLSANNGTGPYSFSVASGALPPGLTLSSSGALTGTPTKGGTFTFSVRATAAGASPGTRTYTVKIVLTVTPTSLPAGTTGVAYSQPLTAVGATAPVTWTVSAGALPPGLAIGADGVVTGTPTQAGSYSFTATAGDASTATGSASYSLTIGSPTLVRVSARLMPPAVRGVAYRQKLVVGGGSAPYTFALVSGVTPAGLRLAANGTIAGVVKQTARTSTFQVEVVDRYGAQATFSYKIVVKNKR